MSYPPISLSAAFAYGGRAAWATAWPLGPLWVLLAVISQGAGVFSELARPESLLGILVVTFAVMVFVFLPNYGITRLCLDHYDGRPLDLGAAFAKNPAFFPSLAFGLIYAGLASAGLMLYIWPGFWILAIFGVGYWIVADRQVGGPAAFAACMALVRGNTLRLQALLILACAPMLLNIWLVDLPGGVGIAPAIAIDAVIFAVFSHTLTYVYRQLAPREDPQVLVSPAA